MRICALIPVYNNADTIGDVIERCRAIMEPDILVVSDGSTDGSDKIAKAAGVEVFVREKNLGKGAAIHYGLKAARVRGYSHAIVLDADGQHLPEEIPSLYEASLKFPKRIWVGTRRMGKTSTPGFSRFGRSISNFWTSIACWQRCKDVQCGFRVYPVDPILNLQIKASGFQYEMEILAKAAWSGIKIDHIDVNVFYPPRDQRVSHFDPKGDNWRFAWLSFRLFWGMVFRIPMLAYRKWSTL